MFTDDDNDDAIGEDSDSDGYLSEVCDIYSEFEVTNHIFFGPSIIFFWINLKIINQDSSLYVAQSDGDNYLEGEGIHFIDFCTIQEPVLLCLTEFTLYADNNGGSVFLLQNKEIYLELVKKTKKLDRLKKKVIPLFII